MEHQDMVDRLVMLKAVRDVLDDAYEAARKEYTDKELERTDLPRGDASQFGEIQGVIGKATKETVEHRFCVSDEEALRGDTSEDFAEWLVNTWLVRNLPHAAEDYFAEVGELLDGCEIVSETTPAQPRKFKYMKVLPTRVAKDSVRDMLSPQLAGLLGGAK